MNMVVDSRLDTTREYVWFLSHIEHRPIKGKPTLIIDWTCKDVDVTVREYLRIPDKLEGSRLLETMKSLGYKQNENEQTITPVQFFEKGLHIKAKPLMYWSELNSEDMKWKLNYETLSPMKEKSRTITPDDLKRLERICSSRIGHNDVLAFLATHSVELIEPFLELSKAGKIKYKNQ